MQALPPKWRNVAQNGGSEPIPKLYIQSYSGTLRRILSHG
jgi:hypothetical protein